MPRNFGIGVGHQDEGSGSKGFSRCLELPGLPSGKENEFGIDVPQLFQRRYDRLKEIRGRIFLRGRIVRPSSL